VVQEQPQHERGAALRRLIDFYLRTARAADRIVEPHRSPIGPDLPPPGPDDPPLPDRGHALAWVESEHGCLLASQALAEEQGWHDAVWQLAWTLDTYYSRRGPLYEMLPVWKAALRAAGHLGNDLKLQARAHRLLGETCAQVGNHTEAAEHLDRGLALTKHAGDRPGQAHTTYILARAWEKRGDDRQALRYARKALRLYQEIGNPAWEDEALGAVGWYLAKLGRYKEARSYLEPALILNRRNDDPEGEAAILDSLGYVAHHSGQYTEAVRHYRQAVDIRGALGHDYDQAGSLEHLGHSYASLNDRDNAQATWQQTLQLYRAQQRLADIDRVQRLLSGQPV
jgi:tetratricopeptide (TPR) repeat protein